MNPDKKRTVARKDAIRRTCLRLLRFRVSLERLILPLLIVVPIPASDLA